MTLPYPLRQSSEVTADFRQAVVKILADCDITGDDATQLSKLKVRAISADLKRPVRFSWTKLVAVDDVLYGVLRFDKKSVVVSKQQLSDEFLNGFCVCEETPKVEQTAIFCLTERNAEEDGEQDGARTHPCLTLLEMEKQPDSDPLCFT